MPEQAANFLTILAARARDVVAILAVLVPIWLFLSDNVKDWVAGVARSAFGGDVETLQVAVANVTASVDTTNSRLAALELALAASTEPPLIFEDAGNSVSDGVIGGVVDLKFMAVKSRNCGRPSISVRFRDSGGFVHAFDTLGMLDDAGRGPALPVRLAPQTVAFRARIPAQAGVETGRADAWLEFGSFETLSECAGGSLAGNIVPHHGRAVTLAEMARLRVGLDDWSRRTVWLLKSRQPPPKPTALRDWLAIDETWIDPEDPKP